MANIHPAGVFDTEYKQDMAIDRTRRDKMWKNLAFILLLIVPILTPSSPFGLNLISDQYVSIFIRIAIFVIAVQGLNILIGYTGQISLGHAAFMAVGAYSSAIFAREMGMSFWVALPISALITGLIGLVFGLPSLRVKGFYLAMATLAAMFIIPWVLRYPMEELTGGNRPLTVPAPMIGPFGAYATTTVTDTEPLIFEAGDAYLVDIIAVDITSSAGTYPKLEFVNADHEVVPSGDVNMTFKLQEDGTITGFSYIATKAGDHQLTVIPADDTGDYAVTVNRSKAFSFASDTAMYYIIIPLSVFLMYLARNVIRTRVGRAFISVRDNDLAAELLGINVFTYKLRAFFLSSVYAGIAGCLIAFHSNSLSLDRFSLGVSIEMLAMLIIGGAGFPLGALFGVAFVSLLKDTIIPALSPILRDILPELLPFIQKVNIDAAVNPILFGVALILILLIEPRGIAHRWEILKVAWKIRPYSY